jgi:hypothetical protein
LSGVSSYPRTGGHYVSPETIQALLAAGYLTEEDVQGYREEIKSFQPSGRELIAEVVRVLLKDRRHDAVFLDRVNDANLLRQASAGAGNRSVTVYHYTGARVMTGFTYENISYERRGDRQHYKMLRYEFDRKERSAWLKEIGTARRQELSAAGLSQKDMDRMAKDGKPPRGYQVHHRIPLDDGGTNNHDNFILIRDDVEHRALHGYYNPAELRIRLLAYGEKANIALPVPPKDTLVYPNPSMNYESKSVNYAKFLEMFDEH